MEKIDSFRNEYRWLSNFWYTKKGFNVETWYQSFKILNPAERERVRKMKPGDSKRWSHTIKVRPDWDSVKVEIMEELVLRKFSEDEELKKKLIETGTAELIEGNTWHDNFWGSCVCEKCGNKGKNVLGKILMEVREKHIENRIDEWHNSGINVKEKLHEYLGWTKEEYEKYVSMNNAPIA